MTKEFFVIGHWLALRRCGINKFFTTRPPLPPAVHRER